MRLANFLSKEASTKTPPPLNERKNLFPFKTFQVTLKDVKTITEGGIWNSCLTSTGFLLFLLMFK